MNDHDNLSPETGEHETLCGCGLSRNLPICDGTHLIANVSPASLELSSDLLPAAAGQCVQSQRSGGRVLVIDDDASMRRMYRDLLTYWGYEVRSADSTRQAVTAIEEGFMPNAIVSDYHLGGGDTGVAAIRAVADRLGRSVPATIVSGPEDLFADGLPVLEKPVSLQQLKEAVAGMLRVAQDTI